MNSDRCSLRHQHGLSERDALKQEWWLNKPELFSALVQGAKRFEEGMGRGGSFRNI
jgi:enoyl-CoA hydratase